MAVLDIEGLLKVGKTVIYKESSETIEKGNWDLWGKKVTEETEVFVYRKIVTFEEAEQYYLEHEILN